MVRSFAVSHLVTAVQSLLHLSQHMLGMVVALILAIASVTAKVVIAALAIHQGIQTADFVQDWHKDSHLLWQLQRDLEAQLANNVLNLQTHRFLAWRSIGCFIYMKCVKMGLKFFSVLHNTCTI